MPKCSICGNEVEKMPKWLDDVNVKFRCGHCPDTSAADLLPGHEHDEEEIEAIHLGPDEEAVSLDAEIEAELEEEEAEEA